MALIEKINAIADKIREVTGTTKKMSLDEIVSEIGCLEVPPETYVLVDDNGNEFAASLVKEPIRLDATENDIRKGYTAATDKGIVTGTKDIPAYHTNQGAVIIFPGNEIKLTNLTHLDTYNYTKLQAIIFDFNSSIDDSVCSNKISIEGKVYPALSTEKLSDVFINNETKEIDFGVKNNTSNVQIVRYFTYKEIE